MECYDAVMVLMNERNSLDMNGFAIEKTADMCVRKVVKAGACVATIVRYSNGRWGVFTPQRSHEVIDGTFNTPDDALRAYAETPEGELKVLL